MVTSDEPDPVVSATVLLRPGPGRSFDTADPTEPPAPEAAAATAGFFAGAGFELGPVVASSFSIAGRRSLFERTFGERLEEDRHEREHSYRTARGSRELDLARVPERVSRHVEAVGFSRPPDFGPTSF